MYFPMSLGWTLYVAPKPPNGDSKTQHGHFPSKITLCLKTDCYKVSVCENCRWQSCKAFIGLSISTVVVSVSTSRSRDGLKTYQRLVSVSSREKLSTSRSRQGLGRQTSRSHLGLGHLRLVPKTVSWWACRWRRTHCEWALDVVSLCCSYYCLSY